MSETKDDSKNYRVFKRRIKKNDPLWGYCDTLCFNSKNMYNTSVFYIRQLMTGLKKEPDKRYSTEKEVISIVSEDRVQRYCDQCFDNWQKKMMNKGNLPLHFEIRLAQELSIPWPPQSRADKKKLKEALQERRPERKMTDKELKKLNLMEQADYFKESMYSHGVTFDSSKRYSDFFNTFCNVMPTAEKWFPGYNLLDFVFKDINQKDYRCLPIHTAQYAIKQAVGAFEGYFTSHMDWKINPKKYTGEPKIPGYKDKNARMTAKISNISAKISKEGKLQLPKLKKGEEVQIYSLKNFCPPKNASLAEVRVVPGKLWYELEIVYELKEKQPGFQIPKRIVAIDEGQVNFIALACNFDENPIVIKGGPVNSINRNWNKEMDLRLSALYEGKDMKEHKGLTSKAIQQCTDKRNARVKDFLHKASHELVKWCEEHQVDTIVIGHNPGQKQNINMGSFANRKFVEIPLAVFNEMVRYKAASKGIQVIEVEESYTSLASCLDYDEIPVYDGTKKDVKFSGKRIKRGLYRSSSGRLVNADIQASGNILRKAFPDIDCTGLEACLKKPVKTLKVLKDEPKLEKNKWMGKKAHREKRAAVSSGIAEGQGTWTS